MQGAMIAELWRHVDFPPPPPAFQDSYVFRASTNKGPLIAVMRRRGGQRWDRSRKRGGPRAHAVITAPSPLDTHPE